ncbi:MAG: GntR family transcriptional regulator [Solirubrobacteraceae bacterium]
MPVDKDLAALSSDGHQTRADVARASLRTAILTGRLKPGERLVPEELAEALGMSKMPVREAVRWLESIGLAESAAYRGARVTELSAKDLRDVYQARLAVEPRAVRHAAEEFGRDDVREASDRLRKLNALGDDESPESWAAHRAFHFLFFERADSAWLLRMIKLLWDTSERYRFATSAPIHPVSPASREEHERILRACETNDPEQAELEHYKHLARTANAIARALDTDEVVDSDSGGAFFESLQ